MLTRRETIALGLGLAATPWLNAVSALAAVADPVSAAFAKSKTKPWTLGFEAPRSRELDTGALELLSGALPKELAGTFYRNGPALFERAGYRYRHWFDGDGMVHRYRFANGRISHRARYVQTKKLLSEDAAGRFVVPAFGSLPDDRAGVSGPDEMNAANTSVLPLGDEVLALWEGGSAYALDGETLTTRGAKTWSEDLKGMPFSAHPKVAPDGTIFNFGADPFGDRVIVYRIGSNGVLQDQRLVELPRVGLMHDFVITERSLVFLASSYRVVGQRLPFLDSFAIDPSLPALAIAIPKSGDGDVRTWDLPPGFVFHFGNAWEESDGTIRLDAAWWEDIRWPKTGAEALMRGEALDGLGARVGLVILLADRKDGELALTDEGEFPRIDPRRVGARHQVVFHTGPGAAASPAASQIVRRDWETGSVDRFDYGAEAWVEEHVFVPSGPGEGEGHLIGTVLNLAAKRTELHVLNAQKISDGPIASFALPYPVPLGFHGAWREA
jgi:carotenoid cleavage dioxygenase-like enzyme